MFEKWDKIIFKVETDNKTLNRPDNRRHTVQGNGTQNG